MCFSIPFEQYALLDTMNLEGFVSLAELEPINLLWVTKPVLRVDSWKQPQQPATATSQAAVGNTKILKKRTSMNLIDVV